MCRWMAYSGASLYLDELLLKPKNSLIQQSLSCHLGAEVTNGDGFGIGWYTEREHPGLYKDIDPAWNNRNLADIAHHIQSRLFLAHVRATTGTPIQQTNCHPFRHKNWLFVHNGLIHGYPKIRRELALNVAPNLYPSIEGSTDSELMFALALGFGLEQSPLSALEKMAGLVEQVGLAAGIAAPLLMTLGLTDGKRLYAVRYSSDHNSRTLFHSKNIKALKKMNPNLQQFSDDAVVVVSEPIGDVPTNWIEIPESTALIIENGQVNSYPFQPKLPEQ